MLVAGVSERTNQKWIMKNYLVAWDITTTRISFTRLRGKDTFTDSSAISRVSLVTNLKTSSTWLASYHRLQMRTSKENISTWKIFHLETWKLFDPVQAVQYKHASTNVIVLQYIVCMDLLIYLSTFIIIFLFTICVYTKFKYTDLISHVLMNYF